MSRLMVVDDQESVAYSAAVLLRRAGHEVDVCADAESALKLVKVKHYSVVVSDLRMEKMSGIDLLKQIRAHVSGTEVIIMTAFASIETAVEATRQGAFDYICKPFRSDDLLEKIERVIDRQKDQPVFTVVDGDEVNGQGTCIMGESSLMQDLKSRASRAAHADCTVLLTGETGTGKSLFAGQIHSLSPRANRPFVAVNCANLSELLLESELFGTMKGAYTGADVSRPGLCEAANQGTLFLDEIGATSLAVQSKLLTLLEDKHIRRLGDTKSVSVDIRIIAATNADLPRLISDHGFREDLFYRLNVVSLRLPPLRERPEDIPALVEYFLLFLARKYHKQFRRMSPDAMQLLLNYNFPGNVRELENIIERAIVAGSGDTLGCADLRIGMADAVPGNNSEREHILRAIVGNKYNMRRVAAQLGLSRTTLYRKLHQYGINAR